MRRYVALDEQVFENFHSIRISDMSKRFKSREDLALRSENVFISGYPIEHIIFPEFDRSAFARQTEFKEKKEKKKKGKERKVERKKGNGRIERKGKKERKMGTNRGKGWRKRRNKKEGGKKERKNNDGRQRTHGTLFFADIVWIEEAIWARVRKPLVTDLNFRLVSSRLDEISVGKVTTKNLLLLHDSTDIIHEISWIAGVFRFSLVPVE